MIRVLTALLTLTLLLGAVLFSGPPGAPETPTEPITPAARPSGQPASGPYQPWRLPAERKDLPRADAPLGQRVELGRFPSIEEHPREIRLPLSPTKTWDGNVTATHAHDNGDLTLVAGSRPGERAVLTVGRAGVFARVQSAGRTFELNTRASGSWLLDLSDERLDVDHFGQDAVAAADSDTSGGKSPPWLPPAELERHTGESALINVMFLHTPAMAERYPGELLETRINHLVAIANQALVDSKIDAQVRLTGLEETDYSRHQDNASALSDLRNALSGEIIPGLEGLLGRRLLYAADLVVLTWPHDIETRGACGIAYYPQIESNGQPRLELGVQITNDGQSNWSVCSDAVFTHELGHNLGAQHQRETIQSPDPQAANFAWTRAGRWHTVMGSFGTGHVDRYRRLDLFSNPSVRCGSERCGSITAGDRADNAGHMNGLAPTVAAYIGTAGRTVDHPEPSRPDTDGDGILDRDDPYPFDSDNGTGPTEPLPTADFSERVLSSTTGDTGQELLVVSSGNDRVLSFDLDGRFRGRVAEPGPVNAGPVLTGFSDLLTDGAGRLYLLASEDVRRFDRLSGRLIDVFLDSALPGPRELQSSFPRAMAWLDDDRLAVLGDNAIEIYDDRGRRLNPASDEAPGTEPSHWSDPVDLPLRALVQVDDVLFVAEASTPRVMSFAAGEGTRGGDVADAARRLTDPRDMALGPDGRVYVANGSADNILRFDPQQRRFVDTFIPAGRGGLDFARALAFGADGDLFVASRDSHAILRFDGDSGQFIGVVADDATSSLDSPQELVIAPVVDEIGAGHSGHYYVPARSGEGWLLEILDDERAAISWFTYPPQGGEDGDQAWVVGVGEIEGRRIVFEDMLATRLTDPNAPIEADNITQRPWGRLEMDFGHCGFGQAHYDSPLFEDSGTLDFARLITIDGLPCGSRPRSPLPGAPGISGQWNDPDSSGQGWFLQEIGDGRVFTAWFTYDEQGRQAWVVGEGTLEGRTLRFDDLVLTRGAAFGSDFDPEAVERLAWGSLEFRFDDCSAAVADFESVLPEYGSGRLRPQRLTVLDQLDCNLTD
jgi:hypothetical protein